jgi:hypothetical protein
VELDVVLHLSDDADEDKRRVVLPFSFDLEEEGAGVERGACEARSYVAQTREFGGGGGMAID